MKADLRISSKLQTKTPRLPKPEVEKALCNLGNIRHELSEIYRAIGEMTGPLNIEDPIEKAEMDALFKACDAVKAAQGRLAACSDKLPTAIAVPPVANA